jgi:hypothetical protein
VCARAADGCARPALPQPLSAAAITTASTASDAGDAGVCTVDAGDAHDAGDAGVCTVDAGRMDRRHLGESVSFIT